MKSTTEKIRPNIGEVAKRAGFSVATVSRVMNDHPAVREATRDIIRRVAREMGYHPDPLVASLAGKGFGTTKGISVAVLTRSPRSTGARDFTDVVKPYGWTLDYFDTLKWPDPSHLARVLRARGYIAIIIHQAHSDQEYFQRFDWRHFVAVQQDDGIPGLDLPKVRTLDTESVWLGLTRMEAMGYRRIGMVFPDWETERILDIRIYGLGLAFQQKHLKRKERIPILPLIPGRKDGNQPLFRNWLEQHRPEAVFAHFSLCPVLFETPQDLRPPFALLGGNMDVAGVRVKKGMKESEVLRTIDREIRASRYGLRETPVHHILASRWHDGPELPPLNPFTSIS